MPPRTLTEAELTAAWLRRQAKEFILRAEQLEASAPGRSVTGGVTAQEVIDLFKGYKRRQQR